MVAFAVVAELLVAFLGPAVVCLIVAEQLLVE